MKKTMRAADPSDVGERQDLREVRSENAPRLQRVQIIDRQHPHFEEYGRFTGKIITMKFGDMEQMAEVALENCRHGVDGCFVGKGQVKAVPER